MTHEQVGGICPPSSKVTRLLAALLPAAAVGAAKLDARPPATQPVARPMAVRVADPAVETALPGSLSLLNKRSIFSRNGMAVGAAGPAKPEAAIALRGIVFDDNDFVVFLEDTAAHRTMQLRPGDALAGGKIGQISLDEFAFEAGGAITQVRVGQNLLGMTVPPVPMAAPAPPPGPAGPPGPPPEAQPSKGPVYEIGPNGQRMRNLPKERAG